MTAEPERRNQNQNSSFSFSGILKTIAVFMIVRSVLNFLTGQSGHGGYKSNATVVHRISNVWLPSQRFSADFYIMDSTTNGEFRFDSTADSLYYLKSGVIFDESNFKAEDGSKINKFIKTLKFAINGDDDIETLNENLQIRVVFYRYGLSSSEKSPLNDKYAFSRVYKITKIMKGKNDNESKNLIFNNEKSSQTKESKEEKIDNLFFFPVINLKIVYDFTSHNLASLPAEISSKIRIHPEQNNLYFPIVFKDDFWILSENMIELKKEQKEIKIDIELSTTGFYKWLMKSNFDHSMQMQSSMLGGVEGEIEMTKRMLRDTNPYFLAVTMIVSLLHFIFEFLAFKNDVTFWKNQSDMTGLSVRTLFFDAFSAVIIFLYLFENETSFMIVVSSFFHILVNIWKLKKAFNFKINSSGGIRNWIEVKAKDCDAKNSTDEYDKVAIKYLSYILLPLTACYSVYSLFYESHKGWYQWLLSSLVGTVYTFGFITMCPQLYINYKLKSVAHLPWRMMTYKALNTVIDDLFAFVIKMPILHRISCFRDDLVFAVFLYQRWIYRVDYNRVNEFGYKIENNDQNRQNNENFEQKNVKNDKNFEENEIKTIKNRNKIGNENFEIKSEKKKIEDKKDK